MMTNRCGWQRVLMQKLRLASQKLERMGGASDFVLNAISILKQVRRD